MKNKIEEKIAKLKSELRYENARGDHTLHLCDCKKRSCRRNRCVICIWKEIKEQEKLLEGLKK